MSQLLWSKLVNKILHNLMQNVFDVTACLKDDFQLLTTLFSLRSVKLIAGKLLQRVALGSGAQSKGR